LSSDPEICPGNWLRASRGEAGAEERRSDTSDEKSRSPANLSRNGNQISECGGSYKQHFQMI
jgi:hypothetical protein